MTPKTVRTLVLFATAFVAFNMYLDRACLSQVMESVQNDLAITPEEKDWVLGAFFWSYALAQVPAAGLAKKHGFRLLLTIYLITWSAFTGLTGLAWGFTTLVIARLMVGLAEAGSYPTASAIVRNWFPQESRGKANSFVALGGRFGFVLALFLTPFLAKNLSWQLTLSAYAMIGFAAAFVFWFVVRDTPGEHPMLGGVAKEIRPLGETTTAIPWERLLASRNVWLTGLHMFGINIGWAFLITKMPEYFTSHLNVPPEERGWVSAFPAVVGCFGMLNGGLLTDWLSKRFGLRRGRAIPLGVLPAVATIAYLSCSQAENSWVAATCIGVMAFAIDMANPSYWSVCQDVGKEHAATVLGFGNMLGNIGAGLSPVVLGAVQRAYGWPAVFYAGAVAFMVAATAGAMVNARRAI